MKKLITTKGTEFEQNRKDLALIDTESRGGMPVMISSSDLNEGFTNAEYDVKTLVGFDVEGEEITITPTTSQQIITPSAGKNAITKATVNAVTLEDKSITITSNTTTTISPGTEYTGLGTVSVTTNIPEPTGNIDITTTNQTNVKDYATAQVVDADLVAGNIKKDVNILGVVGTYEGSGGIDKYFDTEGMTSGGLYTNSISKTIKELPNYTAMIGTSLYNSYAYLSLVDKISINYSTTNVTNFEGMFNSCSALTNVSLFDTSNGISFTNMFKSCTSLIEVPQYNTQNATNFASMFNGCSNLVTVPKLKAGKVVNLSNMFANCTNLENFGGLEEIGKSYLTTASANYNNYTIQLNANKKLTHDSLMNVINNLYDIATAGCNTQKLLLGSDNTQKLTAEEIAIATNKGWNVS